MENNNNNIKSFSALLLAGMMVAGLGLAAAGQGASAHDFTQDEGANFIAMAEKIKVHLSLARSNLGRSAEVAHEHVEHAAMLLGKDTIAEIAEKNKRIARDLPASLEALGEMIHEDKPRADVRKQIAKVNALVDEAVSARVDRQQLRSGAVQATVIAQMASESLGAYEAAFGVKTEEAEAHGHGSGSSGSGHSGSGGKIVDRSAYDASKAFASKAASMYGKVNRLAPEGSDAAMAEVKDGLAKLRSAINHKEHVDEVMVIVHGQIHENLIQAFGLDAGKSPLEEEDDHGA
jgi:hypothetical protein